MEGFSRWLVEWLLNSAWQIALVAGVACIGDKFLRRGPARCRHVLWVAALALSLALPLLSLDSGAGAHVGARVLLLPLPSASPPSSPQSSAAASRRTGSLEQGQFMPRDSPTAKRKPGAGPAPVQPGWSTGSGLLRGLPRRRDLALPVPVWLAWGMICCYLFILVIKSTRLVRAWLRTREIMRTARRRPLPDPLREVVARWQASLGLANVPILFSDCARGPLTLGAWHPAILLPEGLLDAVGADDLAAALCHEMVHMRRRDYLWNVIYQAAYLLVAFHPAVGLVRRRIDQTRELACDEIAAACLTGPSYARSLVNIARSIAVPAELDPVYMLGVLDAGILEERIMRLLDKTPKTSARAARILLVASACLLALCTLAASLFTVNVSATPREPSASAGSAPDPIPVLKLKQESGRAEVKPDSFAGIWQAVFQGKPFMRLKLKTDGQTVTGSVSNGEVRTDSQGNLTAAEAHEGEQKVIGSRMKQGALILTVKDPANGDTGEYQVNLTGGGRAELSFPGDPPPGVVMPKPFKLVRAQGASALPLSGINTHSPVAHNTSAAASQTRDHPMLAADGASNLKPTQALARLMLGPEGKDLTPSQAYARLTELDQKAFPAGTQVKASTVPGATDEGSITGTVFDPSGARVPDAVVSILNQQGSQVKAVPTDQEGKFQADHLLPGRYTLEVIKAGFAIYRRYVEVRSAAQNAVAKPSATGPEKQTLGGVDVEAKQEAKENTVVAASALQDIVLAPGEILESVVVIAKAGPNTPSAERLGPKRIRVGGLVQTTKLINPVKPEYPQRAKDKGIEGTVLVQAVISKEGEPLSLHVLSSPDQSLTQAAEDAVKQWRYEPTLLNGEPVEVQTTIGVRFQLER